MTRFAHRAYDDQYRVHLALSHAPTHAACDHNHKDVLRLYPVKTSQPLTCLWCVVIDTKERFDP